MGRDLGDDAGSDQAAWLDLVARIGLPSPVDPTHAPWPDRENLPGAAAAGDNPDGAGEPTDPAHTMLPPPGTASLSPCGDQPEPRPPGRATNRGRVIRPAGFVPVADQTAGSTDPNAKAAPSDGVDPSAVSPWYAAADNPANHPAYWSSGGADAGSHATSDHGPGTRSGTDPDEADESDFIDPIPWRASARDLSAEDYLNLADISYVDYDIGNEDDRYVPPPVPPQPKLDPVARGAWAALFGGPCYLFIATLLSWQIPGWAELAAIIAFVAGFVVLVVRLGDGPSKRDGPDQGAVL
jgi:hypothetical protein